MVDNALETIINVDFYQPEDKDLNLNVYSFKDGVLYFLDNNVTPERSFAIKNLFNKLMELNLCPFFTNQIDIGSLEAEIMCFLEDEDLDVNDANFKIDGYLIQEISFFLKYVGIYLDEEIQFSELCNFLTSFINTLYLEDGLKTSVVDMLYSKDAEERTDEVLVFANALSLYTDSIPFELYSRVSDLSPTFLDKLIEYLEPEEDMPVIEDNVNFNKYINFIQDLTSKCTLDPNFLNTGIFIKKMMKERKVLEPFDYYVEVINSIYSQPPYNNKDVYVSEKLIDLYKAYILANLDKLTSLDRIRETLAVSDFDKVLNIPDKNYAIFNIVDMLSKTVNTLKSN